MAKERSYLRAVKKTETGSARGKGQEETRTDYREKIRRHRMSSLYRILLVAAALLVVTVIVYMQYKSHIYTDYDVVSSYVFSNVEDTEIMRLGDNILTYSRDGAHCTNAKGDVMWNQTFEMQDILTATSGDVVAIADYNGRQIYVLNASQKLCEITTNMPIRNLSVSANGCVAVAVADTKITWIYIYNADGSLAYEVKTTMGQSGYPIAFSLSPNGELLGVSCVYVDAGVVKTRLAFYNFGPVGSNMTNYLVSADNYPDTIIPYISFMDDDTALVVGEDRMLLYEGSQKPTLQSQHLINEEIQAVYHNEKYIGLVLNSDRLDKQHKMDVYTTDAARKIGTYYVGLNYDDILFTEDYFVAYNSMECVIQTYGETTKFEGEFLTSTDLLFPVGKGKSYKFIQVTRDAINTIQLK